MELDSCRICAKVQQAIAFGIYREQRDLFSGAAACHYAVKTNPRVDEFGYWAASDIFFEAGPHLEPYGGFNQYYGILTIHGSPKPIFHAFKFLSRMEGPRYEPANLHPPTEAADAICTASGSATRALFWNYHHPGQARKDWHDEIVLPLSDHLKDAPLVRVVTATLKAGQGSAFEAWKQAGRPANLTRTEEEALAARSVPIYRFVLARTDHGAVTVPFSLKPDEILFMEVASAVEDPRIEDQPTDLDEMNRELDYAYD